MKGRHIPDSVQVRLRALLEQHNARPVRNPTVGDCFFVNAPTLYPEAEPDQALLAAIEEAPSDMLLCLNMSMEYWEGSEYDYLLDPKEWTGGYPAIVEAWNRVLVDPVDMGRARIHGRIQEENLEEIRALSRWHQAGQSPPGDFLAAGNPLPEDEMDPRWQFHMRETGLMERVRCHLHEGWNARVLPFPRTVAERARKHAPVEVAAADAVPKLGGAIGAAIRDARRDLPVMEDETGALFVRRDSRGSVLTLVWYSPAGKPPPEVETDPPMGTPAVRLRGETHRALGSWRIVGPGRDLLLHLRIPGRPLSVRLAFRRGTVREAPSP
jgi:hypothetical protein